MALVKQPLWANCEKLIALMDESSQSVALDDWRHAHAQPLGAYKVRVVEFLYRYFEPASEECDTPEAVYGVLSGRLFTYSGRTMNCRGFHHPRDDNEASALATIRIGRASSPSTSSGQARLSHSLVDSVDTLGISKYSKYLLAAKLGESAFIPLIAGVTILDLDPDETSPERYRRLNQSTPIEFADYAVSVCKREVELGHAWRLFETKTPQTGEKQFQYVFELVCNALSIDFDVSVDPQADHGAGTVDLCISRGALDPCCIELKVSSHKDLEHGLRVQLPAYMRSKSSTSGRFVVLCTKEGKSAPDVKDRLGKVAIPAGLSIDTVIIDAQGRPSASRR